MVFILLLLELKKDLQYVRDEIACKPAVIAETKNYVADCLRISSNGSFTRCKFSAKIFEPDPGIVYSWGTLMKL